MSFIDVIFKNLRQRKTRTAFTVAGLAVAVMAIASLWNIAWGYARSANAYYAGRGVDIVVVRAGVSDRLTSSLRADLATRLLSLPEIDSVDGGLTEMVSLGENSLIGIPLRGFAPVGFTISQLAISEGRNLRPNDQGTVLLGSSLAASLDKQAGQRIEIEGTQFDIAGVFQSASPFETNSIIAPLDDVQRLMDRPGIVSEFQIRAVDSIRDQVGLRELCRKIEALHDDQQTALGLKAQPTHDFVGSATESIFGTAMAWCTSAIVLMMSVLGMLNTMLMSVMERTRELGILRAVGWPRGRVVRMILGESIVISLVATVVGLIFATILMFVMSRWSATSMFVPASLSRAAMALGLVSAMLAGVAGTFYPAYCAADVPPTEALRHE
jgi:putative ABC transport system permease protein